MMYNSDVGQTHEGADTDYADLPFKTLLRPDEVAHFLSVSLKTIYRWHRSGVIDGTKVNRSLRIYRGSVLKLLEENAGGLSAHEEA